jgi:hypothetical protein
VKRAGGVARVVPPPADLGEAGDAASPAQPGPDAAAPVETLPAPRRSDLNSLETRIVTRELEVLVGGYLEKAYQPNRDEVLLRFRVPGSAADSP